MSLRVPTSTTYGRLERGLAVSLSRVQTLQGQLASQSRISKLSDDPVGAATGLRLRSQETDWAAYSRTADDATAALGTTDGALQTTSTLLRRINELAISAANGALDGSSRAALGAEIGSLRDQLVDVANTDHLGRAVFGGHRTSAVSADRSTSPPTFAYAGDGGTVSRQVSPSVTLAVNMDGRALFGFDGAAGSDLFSTLTDLEAAVRSGSTVDVTAGQQRLRAHTVRITNALGQVGAAQNRVASAVQLGTTVSDRLVEQRSAVEDVDLAATILRLQAAENGYSAALGAVARADLPSLADFLR